MRLAPISIALTVGAALTSSWAAAANNCFNGYAYPADGGSLLYVEAHEQTLNDGRLAQWQVEYRSANAEAMGAEAGQVIARKQFDFSENAFVPAYTLDILDEGYREGIRHDDRGWRMIRRESANAPTESEAFEYAQPMAADSGFDPFVKAHFDELMAGETVRFDFAAAGRLDVISLRAYKTGTTEFAGRQAVQFTAELDSLLRFLVDSLLMTYDRESKKLLRYEGVSNLRNSAGETFPVVIKYLEEPPPGAADLVSERGYGKAADAAE